MVKKEYLGIPVVEDRLLHGVVRLLLEAIFETDLQLFSYGYRVKIGAQISVKDITYELQFGRSGYVVEAEIKASFSAIGHDWLLQRLTLSE